MPISRRLLLLLVFACLLCVLLLQKTMDDRATPDHLPIPENNISQTKQQLQNRTVATKPTTALTSSNLLLNFSNLSIIHDAQNPRIEGKIQRLQLTKKIPRKHLISKQDRLQEILKSKPVLDPMRTLRAIPLVDPSKVKRILVLTYFRSGSTFFGDILQQNWKTFYHFEPLHSKTYDKRVEDSNIQEVFSLFDDIFHCNFTHAKEYMKWVRQARNQFLFSRNTFLMATCHGSKLCFEPSFVNSVCARATVQVAKVPRLQMRHLRQYLERSPDLNFQVVYLTRDPRGILSSRWSLDWCKVGNCSRPDVLCSEMNDDIRHFEELRRQMPNDVVQVRYEDLSSNPEEETRKLFQFLNLPYSSSVSKFLKTHTVGGHKADNSNPYSTRRNSSSMVSSWRERFTFQKVLEVQEQCQQVLQTLNYTLITAPEQLPYPEGRPEIVKRYYKNPLALKYLTKNMNVEVHKTIRKGTRSF